MPLIESIRKHSVVSAIVGCFCCGATIASVWSLWSNTPLFIWLATTLNGITYNQWYLYLSILICAISLAALLTIAYALWTRHPEPREPVSQKPALMEEELRTGVFIVGGGTGPDLNIHEEVMAAYPVRFQICNSHPFPIFLTAIAAETYLVGRTLGKFSEALHQRVEIPGKSQREHIFSIPLTAKDAIFIKKCESDLPYPRFSLSGQFSFETPFQTRFVKVASGDYTSIIVSKP